MPRVWQSPSPQEPRSSAEACSSTNPQPGRKGRGNKHPNLTLPHPVISHVPWHPTPVLCLENPMDGGAWRAAVHGVAEGRTRLSDFPFTFHFHALEKEMAIHCSVLAWRIPGTGEPGGLSSMGSHRVGHD